jgi:hypothetical protein
MAGMKYTVKYLGLILTVMIAVAAASTSLAFAGPI